MITQLDHLVLTVEDIPATIKFYTEVLGIKATTFGDRRQALCFGSQKINLHQSGREFEPKAAHPTPGSADLCFLSDAPLQSIAAELAAYGVSIIEGPVARAGATGPIISLYFRDPDGNLIEVSNLEN